MWLTNRHVDSHITSLAEVNISSGNYKATWKPLVVAALYHRHFGSPSVSPIHAWVMHCEFHRFLPLHHCFSTAPMFRPAGGRREHSGTFSRTFTICSRVMSPLTTPVLPLLPEMSNYSQRFRIIGVIWLVCRFPLTQPNESRAPSSDEKVSS